MLQGYVWLRNKLRNGLSALFGSAGETAPGGRQTLRAAGETTPPVRGFLRPCGASHHAALLRYRPGEGMRMPAQLPRHPLATLRR